MIKKLIVPIVILAIGAIGFFVWAQNNYSGSPAPADFYAPNFWFDSDEKYFPADPLDFYYENNEEISGERAVSKYNNLSLSKKLSNFKVFYAIKDQGNEWVYEYWLFYVMNAFENGHYGDWESVFVFVDKNSGKITKVNGSAHGSSNELNNLGDQKHIWVYVGNGSHANCPDESADTQCKFLLWNWREQWNKNGSKIYYDQYTLKESNDAFVQNFKDQKSFNKEKSPTLGINPFRILKLEKFGFSKLEKDIYLNLPIIGELFGRTPYHAWAKPEYDNPELIRPWTNVAMERIQNFVQDTKNNIQNSVNLAISELRFIFSQINPFQAGLAPNVARTIQESEEAAEETFTDISQMIQESPDLSEEDLLFAMQDRLDDAAESIDILIRGTTELFIENNGAEENLSQESQEKEEEIIEEEVEDDEEDEEDVSADDNMETTENATRKLCEKSVDNFPKRDKIVISEIAWMGTNNSADDEWIELKNTGFEPINLGGWQLLDKGGQIKVVFNSQAIAPANGFYLLERTDDTTLPEAKADLIYQGGLNNADEALFLFDANCQLADEVFASPEWSAGDNVSKRTMERKQDFGWQASANAGGTPKSQNSAGFLATDANTTPTGGSGGAITPLNPAVPQEPSPEILITEIQIGDAVSGDHDFIELYNPNATTVDLSGWQMKKKNSEGNESSIRVFPENSVIAAENYFVWMNYDYVLQSQNQIAVDATSSQTLASNNSVVLLDKNKNIMDAVAWGTGTDQFLENFAFPENPTDNQSLGRKWSTTTENYIDADNNLLDFEIQNPTPKSQNQSPEIPPEPEPEPESPTLAVVINEIAWMGTNSQNSSDEWIELYNNTTDEIDLIDWTLTWSHGTTTRSFTFSTSTGATTTISAQKFFLLERTDDDAVSDISAGQFLTGGLDNGGEKLELRDASSALVDLIDGSAGWFAGTTSPAYISMERINPNATGSDPANWQDNNLVSRNGKAADNANINGTPASQNSVSKTETEINWLPFAEFDEITLTYLGSPYIIQNTLHVPQNKKLVVEPAVTLKFHIPNVYGPNEGAYLKMDGALEAVGEPGKEILFTSTGVLWPGIVFEAENPETEISSRLEYVKIEKARTWEVNSYAAVKVVKKAVSIKNSTFENHFDLRGLYLLNSSSSIENVVFNNFNASSADPVTGEYPSGIFIDRANPTIKNNIFNNNYQAIVVGTMNTCLQNPDFKISGNTFNGIVMPIYITDTGFPCFENNQIIDLQRDNRGNLFDGVVYQGATMGQDNLWQSDLPIILEKGFAVQNATLTVAAGATIKFQYSSDVFPNTYLKISNGSRLITQGTADKMVVFTSNKEAPNPGSWQAVWFDSGSSGELNFTRIYYGGFGSGAFRNECLIIDADLADVVLNDVETAACSPYE